MNKKGFTLMEIIAIIAITGLIITLAVTSILGITHTIKVRQRENIIKRIEASASKYAFDTGATLIYVDTLIKNGYYDLNEKDGNLIDPVNNESLNCYKIEITKEGNYYHDHFIENSKDEDNGECNINSLILVNNIHIEVTNYNGDLNNWISGDAITLTAYGNKTIDCEKNTCIWNNNINNSNVLTLNNISSGNYNYTFTYRVKNKDISAEKTLKIDNGKPTVTFEIEGITTAKYTCSDALSGIDGTSSNEIKLTGTKDYTYDVVCVDNAGNSINDNHVYKYSDCASGKNTCSYGCDSYSVPYDYNCEDVNGDGIYNYWECLHGYNPYYYNCSDCYYGDNTCQAGFTY